MTEPIEFPCFYLSPDKKLSDFQSYSTSLFGHLKNAKDGVLHTNVIGYRLIKKEGITAAMGNHEPILYSKALIYCDDGKIYWSSGSTFIGPLLNLLKLFGGVDNNPDKCMPITVHLHESMGRQSFVLTLDKIKW